MMASIGPGIQHCHCGACIGTATLSTTGATLTVTDYVELGVVAYVALDVTYLGYIIGIETCLRSV